ncbi:MAG: hypothetical protein B7Z75_03970 [Acidocella sp. 20-57-95]|nr:MAG: hypothetical protein B7Z75_03970 [Acidocella sp. 20-57-95]HQT63914.1 hypothetical protein [Acidocella sp.]
MSSIKLILGPVAFQDFEVPSKIQMGGRQILSVHEFIGGGRAVDAMGAQDAEITFSGVFSGANAYARALLLDTARVDGSVLPIGWDNYFFRVVIHDIQFDYQKSWWLPFKITCTIVPDPVGSGTINLLSGVDVVAADLAYATTLAAQTGISGQLISPPLILANKNVANSVLVDAGGQVASNWSAFMDSKDRTASVVTLDQVAESSAILAGSAAMIGYLNRAAKNIAAPGA